jgi:hypothetical protein
MEINTTPAANVISTSPPSGTTSELLKRAKTTKEAILELLQYDTQHKRLNDEIKQLVEQHRRCELKLIAYMQKNDIIQLAVNKESYLQLRERKKEIKPKSEIMLARLTEILQTGERDPMMIFKFMRRPVSTGTDYVLSKRHKRKPRIPSEGGTVAKSRKTGSSIQK